MKKSLLFLFTLLINFPLFSKSPEINTSIIKPQKSSDFSLLLRKVCRELVSGMGNLDALQLKRFLVVPVKSKSSSSQSKDIAQVITGQVSHYLSSDHKLLLSSKEDLKDVLDSHSLSQIMGNEEVEKKLAELSKKALIDIIVKGELSSTGGTYYLNLTAIDTSSSKRLTSTLVEFTSLQMKNMKRLKLALKRKDEALQRSLMFPGWGQFYNEQDLKAYSFLGAEILSILGVVTMEILAKDANEKYESKRPPAGGPADANFQKDLQNLKSNFNRYKTTQNILIGVAVGVWAVSAIDAYLSGVDGEKYMMTGSF